jgi:hypothetical protein
VRSYWYRHRRLRPRLLEQTLRDEIDLTTPKLMAAKLESAVAARRTGTLL